VIVLDHNIPRDQVRKLRSRRIRCDQVGYQVGRPEWDDQQEILRYLHRGKRLTFVTRDEGFFRRGLCHANYCIVVVSGPVLQIETLVVRFLRHRRFRTKAQRVGSVVRLSEASILLIEKNQAKRRSVAWDV
jgi:hypothetical protein